MKVAVIPARGGSKRIPDKNIREFCGKPMIAWSIENAEESSLFDRIIVSTDSPKISKIAKSLGAEVPFVRPSELSDDHASTESVMAHAVNWMLEANWDLEAICCVYATTPFLRPSDLCQGFDQLRQGEKAYVVMAIPYAHPIQRAFYQGDQGQIEMVYPNQFKSRTQDLPVALHDAGQAYWGWPESWAQKIPILSERSGIIKISAGCAIDIDEPEDWVQAENLFLSNREGGIQG